VELGSLRSINIIGAKKIIIGYKTDGEHWSSVAVQCCMEPEIYHGSGIYLLADARGRMQGQSKNHDKLIYFYRVMRS
jgi:hypothetical protein